MKLTEEAERRRGRGTATQLAIQPSADLRAWRRRRCRPPPSCAPVAVPRVPVVETRFVCIRSPVASVDRAVRTALYTTRPNTV
jgi:hypothetical protein